MKDLTPFINDGEPLRPWLSHEWTPEEQAFAHEYLRTQNAAKAYRRSFNADGMSHAEVVMRAGDWLKQPWMKDYFAYETECAAALYVSDKDAVVGKLARIMQANPLDYFNADGEVDLSGITRDQAAAIGEFTVNSQYDAEGNFTGKSAKIKLIDPVKAAELLGRHHKMWTDVVETNTVVDEAEELRRYRQRARKREDDDEQPDE